MNVVQRQFGKLTFKGAGNDAQISIVLQDFDEVDKMLTKIIDASKALRNAWVSILTIQLGIVTGFDELYNPIVGSSEKEHGHQSVGTPQEQLERASKLKEVYGELKTDLLDEVNMMDARIIRPAMDAKEYIQPIKKTIKNRDNKRLDYERYQDRVSNAHKKLKHTERDSATLARSEEELAKAADEFKVADAHLKENLPPIVTAAFSILPHLLAAQIMTQNTLLGQYYTILHNYCQDQGFQSPPPSMEDVISQWEQDFKPIQRDAEAINVIARGKAVHASMQLSDNPKSGSSVTGLGIRNHIYARRGSSQQIASGAPSPSIRPEPRTNRIPSTTSIRSTATLATPEDDEPAEPDDESRSTSLPYGTAHIPAGPARDYFSRDRQSSNGSSPGITLSSGASVVGKRKPPPPPPKRLHSNAGLFVTAIYTFNGQETGDLSFKEGDVIKVLKKTGSTDDWWEGELEGQRGKFPANYCQMV